MAEDTRRTRDLLRAAASTTTFSTLEDLFVSRWGFGVSTASPLQRAILRVLEGRPVGDLWDDPIVSEAFGGSQPLTGKPPHQMLVCSGIRTGKSLLTACTAVYWSQTVNVAGLSAGDTPRISVMSVYRDQAGAVFDHIVGNVRESPVLSRLVVDQTGDSIVLRHPTGRPVEIKVVAGARAGTTLIARWSAGVIFDEAPRMVGEEDGVVNLDQQVNAVVHRLLPGASMMFIGSPWAPRGPVYEMVQQNFGKPTHDMVVVKAPAHHMNPVGWPPNAVELLRERNPEAYRTDIMAEFADPEANLFSPDVVQRCTRTEPIAIPPDEGMMQDYVAAMDPATRGNAWPLVILTKEDGIIKVVLAMEWIGSKWEPLQPKVVLSQIADILHEYGVRVILSDQYMADALRDMALDEGLYLHQVSFQGAERSRMFLGAAARLNAGLVELPPVEDFRTDLISCKRRPTKNGVQIILPETGNGRHADYAAAFVMAMSRYLEDAYEVPDEEDAMDDVELGEVLIAEAELAAASEENDTDWCDREWD